MKTLSPQSALDLCTRLFISSVLLLSLAACGDEDDTQDEGQETTDTEVQEEEDTQDSSDAGSSDQDVPEHPGETFYKAKCNGCHADDFMGSNFGPDIREFVALNSVEVIAGVIQNGIGTMPANLLNGEDAPVLAAWLKAQDMGIDIPEPTDVGVEDDTDVDEDTTDMDTTPDEDTTDMDTTPDEDTTDMDTTTGEDTGMGGPSVALGEEIYTGNCAGCHGADGTRSRNINNAVATWTEAELANIMVNGRGGMPGVLNQTDAEHVAAYLKTW